MGSQPETLLDVLRRHSQVDCDTFDDQVPKELGPFVDCTSNQAIAYHELIRVDGSGKRVHAGLIRDAVEFARAKQDAYPGASPAELAVECMMVKLALRIAPYLTGYSHVQTNTMYSFSTAKTIENAKRIVAIFRDLDPKYDTRRVCIKIPSTWEGLRACAALEADGIATLATTMFSLEQAALAAHARCTYIAPYINQLRVHFDAGFVDDDQAFGFCGAAQRFYEATGAATQVLPASLTSVQEVMRLAGAHHITVAPALLKKLAETPANPWEGDTGSAFRAPEGETFADYGAILEDEGAWRLAFARSGGGKNDAKLTQAINIFCEKQEGLEALAREG